MDIKAPTAEFFCSIIGRGSSDKLKGFWKGSAYRDHPRGIIRDRMIFTNKWSVHNYCCVQVITDPAAKVVLGCQNPAAHGDPYPKVSSGDLVTVYRDGRFIADGPWVQLIPQVLEEVRAELEALDEAERAENEARQREAKAAAFARLEAARAAFSD